MTRKRRDLKRISAYRKLEKKMRRGSEDTEIDALKEIFLGEKPSYRPPDVARPEDARPVSPRDRWIDKGRPIAPKKGKPSLLERIKKFIIKYLAFP